MYNQWATRSLNYPRPKSITHIRTFSDNGVYVALEQTSVIVVESNLKVEWATTKATQWPWSSYKGSLLSQSSWTVRSNCCYNKGIWCRILVTGLPQHWCFRSLVLEQQASLSDGRLHPFLVCTNQLQAIRNQFERYSDFVSPAQFDCLVFCCAGSHDRRFYVPKSGKWTIAVGAIV